MDDQVLALGKIPDAILSDLLGKYTNSQGDRVLLGPALGEDAGIIDMGHAVTSSNNCLVAAVDPITVGISNAPYFAVAVNINDIVTRGARPKWASSCVFFPEGTTLRQADKYFAELHAAITPHDIAIVTGHTEVSSTVRNPGIVLTMLGEVDKDKIVTTAGAQIGDMVILTGGAGIEGTALLAADLMNETDRTTVSDDVLKRGKAFLHDPGICVAEAAYIACQYQPNSMHDPTEGGVRRGLEELALAADKGIMINYESIPIREETRIICNASGKDPLAIFGSGGLLVTLPLDRGEPLLETYRQAGILAVDIGRITEKSEGRKLKTVSGTIPLKASVTDQLIESIMK